MKLRMIQDINCFTTCLFIGRNFLIIRFVAIVKQLEQIAIKFSLQKGSIPQKLPIIGIKNFLERRIKVSVEDSFPYVIWIANLAERNKIGNAKRWISLFLWHSLHCKALEKTILDSSHPVEVNMMRSV